MPIESVLGWTATILFTVCYVPQIIKTIKSESIEGLSFLLLFISFVANIIAFVYATMIEQPPLQFKYAAGLVFLSICMYLY